MSDLRRLKGEAHFLIALDELAGFAGADLTVRRLSALADACTNAGIDFLLRDAHQGGKLALPDPARPGDGSGWIVLGMGKLGAHELNFSSDIDLVVFFEPEAPAVVDPLDATELFSRLTRRLVRILQDRTDAGYVFRTDLRSAARSRLDAAGDPGRGGPQLLRGARPELGTGGDDQGAADRRRHRRRQFLSQGTAALCLAQIHGFRGDRRRSFDQAPDPRA